MPRSKGRRSKADTKKSSASWTATKNDHSKQSKVFDPLAASVRKNKEYLELKRDIALKARANRKLKEEKKKNNEKEEPTYYVDRDRAAAIVVGSKDIKSELKKKSRNEGQSREDDNPFFAAGGPGTGTYENYDACIAQGEHELRNKALEVMSSDVVNRNGDPRRALVYLNYACSFEDLDPLMCSMPFILRSQCFAKIGSYECALIDAEIALEFEPGSFRALLAMAEALYHTASFEYSLLYYYRAKKIRPKHADPSEGIVKNRNAIINSLSSCNGKYIFGANINEAKIRRIVTNLMNEEEELKINEEKDGLDSNIIKSVRGRQKQCLNLSFELPERVKSPSLDTVTIEFPDEISSCDESCKSCKDAVFSDIQLAQLAGFKIDTAEEEEIPSISPEIESLKKFQKIHFNGDITKFARKFSESLKSKNETKTIKNKRKRNINIDQILLGPLTTDTAFLKKLVDNPKLVIKKKDAFGEDLPFGCCQDEILRCAKEALEYIDDRREFWRKQEPVYARLHKKKH